MSEQVMSQTEAQAQDSIPDRPNFGRTHLFALYGMLALFAALFALAALAPISGGAIAMGTVSPDGSRRTVQHFEGGIVSQILVRDGDRVRAGETLIVLDDTRAKSQRNISLARLNSLLIVEARLEAQLSGRRSMDLGGIDLAVDERLADVASNERSLLEKENELTEAQLELLDERIAQFESEIEGHDASITSMHIQLGLLKSEISGAETLVEKQLYAEPRLLALKREEASIEGQISNFEADIARLKGQISEVAAQKLEMESQRRTETAQNIANVRSEILELEDLLLANQDTLSRTEIVSPIDGEVVALKFKTVGGVIRSGEPILDIVPNQEELVIEARVSPMDADIVSAGQSAQITFSSLKKNLPQISGIVQTVSADALVDEKTGATYFSARVTVPLETLNQLGIDQKIAPGIPADIILVTESRTVFDYLLEPLRNSLSTAMKESN